MHTWELQEAKSRFSKVVDLSMTEGPQMVTRRGQEAVVILAAQDFRRLTGATPSLHATLLGAPRGEPLHIDRSAEAIRDVPL